MQAVKRKARNLNEITACVSIIKKQTWRKGKKNAVREDCVKSTPKEEGGGDTIWIGASLLPRQRSD